MASSSILKRKFDLAHRSNDFTVNEYKNGRCTIVQISYYKLYDGAHRPIGNFHSRDEVDKYLSSRRNDYDKKHSRSGDGGGAFQDLITAGGNYMNKSLGVNKRYAKVIFLVVGVIIAISIVATIIAINKGF